MSKEFPWTVNLIEVEVVLLFRPHGYGMTIFRCRNEFDLFGRLSRRDGDYRGRSDIMIYFL